MTNTMRIGTSQDFFLARKKRQISARNDMGSPRLHFHRTTFQFGAMRRAQAGYGASKWQFQERFAKTVRAEFAWEEEDGIGGTRYRLQGVAGQVTADRRRSIKGSRCGRDSGVRLSSRRRNGRGLYLEPRTRAAPIEIPSRCWARRKGEFLLVEGPA